MGSCANVPRMAEHSTPLSPSDRLLCGPGPTNVDPAALEAMRKPMLGHLDPELHDILLDLVGLLRSAYRAESGIVLPLQSTGTSGMEAGIANLVERGDTVIVGASGYFGTRIAEVARRYGADVVRVTADWGRHVPNARLLAALDENPHARLLAVVHGETSTGTEHPLAELGAAMRDSRTLLMADCVTTLGGVELDFDGWGIDYAYSCTQKCLAAPPGMSPIAVSDRAIERSRRRRTPVPFSMDFELLKGYWVDRPATYHHTAPILHIYALHEVLRQTALEGLEQRWARHTDAGRHLQQRARDAGFELVAEPDHQLAPLTAIRVPEGVDGKAVQERLLAEDGIEVGGGLGPQAPAMWRVGLMGPNASRETADRVLGAITAALDSQRVAVAG
jgi:alanine-glyoxylate transaminase / serine-glyoxylate transaminase / serine-pyruvate transaminase